MCGTNDIFSIIKEIYIFNSSIYNMSSPLFLIELVPNGSNLFIYIYIWSIFMAYFLATKLFKKK